MAEKFLSVLGLAFLMVLVSENQSVVARCEGDIQGLIQQCSQYVKNSGGPSMPSSISQACCDVIAKVDVPCACKFVDASAEQIISMKKVVYVLRHCGKPLARGTKCGSYTVPAA